MDSFFFRYRNPLVLLAVLVAQIVGLAVQVRHTDSGRNTLDPQDGPGVRLIRLWASEAVTPPERLIHSARIGSVWLWQNYIDLRHTQQQNQDLQRTIDRLRLEQAALLEDAKQGERLQALVDFQQKYIYKTVAAQAIGSSGSDQSHLFYIDKGADYHLERDMAVITPDGIVGKVRDVFPHSAQVLEINDQTSGAGVILATTRIRGTLRGNAIGQPQIIGILADQRIQPGEQVLTAGGDMIFPRGLPVGVVEKVIRDPDRDAFIDVIVKPAAQLDRLDEVLVITSTDTHFSPQQQQDMAASDALKGPEAADLLARKKAAAIMAERLPGLTDPNAPAPSQTPGQPATTPTPPPAPKILPAAHPDRFSPGVAPEPVPNQPVSSKPESTRPEANGTAQAGASTLKPAKSSKPPAQIAPSKPAPPKSVPKPSTQGSPQPAPATTPQGAV